MMGVKYIKSGFYQEKNSMIGDAVQRYAEAKATEGMDPEEFAEVKRSSEEILGNIMFESGFREEDEAYINLDKEFFDENSQFDEKKLADFQKLMIRHYGLQDVKWTFAGTTAALTQVTKKVFEENNHDYADMLPIELKREYTKEQQEKHLSKDPNSFTLFLYPDGSTSESYNSKKAQVNFENLKDRSGFDWSKGYTPDNDVNKSGWSAGFNEHDEWEFVSLADEDVEVNESNTADPTAFFTEEYRTNKDLVTFITLPQIETKSEKDEQKVEESSQARQVKKVSPAKIEKIIEKKYKELVKSSGLKEESFKELLKESGVQAEELKSILKRAVTISPKFKAPIESTQAEQAEIKAEAPTGDSPEQQVEQSSAPEAKVEPSSTPEAMVEQSSVPEVKVELKELVAESGVKEEQVQIFLAKSGIKEESFKEIALKSEPVERAETASPGGETILFDHNSRLMEGKEQKFYSVTGELYGVREIDREASIKGIKSSLKRQGVKTLAALVVADTNEETINYYKENFGELITAETRFYTRSDSELEEKLVTMKEHVIEQEAGEELLSGFFSLAEKGRRGEELYEGLIPSVKSSSYQVSLNIFNSQDDLDTFISLPQVKGKLDAEVINYLETVNVPEQKRVAYSNSVQNIIHNYDKLFRNVNIEKVALLKAALDVVSGNGSQLASELKVLGEKGLTELVKDGSLERKVTDIPSFKQVVKKSGDYYDLLDEEELTGWVESELPKSGLSPEVAAEVKRVILSKKIPAAKAPLFSRAIQNSFNEFKSIAMSTGMRPVELVEAVNEIVILNDPLGQFRTKKVFFEKPLAELVEESTKGNLNLVSKVKKDIYLLNKSSALAEELDLLKEQDINTFVASSFLNESGLEESEIAETVKYLKSVTIPAHKSREFTRGVMNIIKNYKEQISLGGTSPLEAVKMVESRIKSAAAPVAPEVEPILESTISSESRRVEESLETFIEEKRYEEYNLNEVQFTELLKEHKEAYKGMQNRYFKTIPVKYKEVEVGQAESNEMTGVDLPPQLVYKSLANSIKNLGFVSTKTGNNSPRLNFTEDGRRLSQATREKIRSIAGHNSRVETEEERISYNNYPLVNTSGAESYYSSLEVSSGRSQGGLSNDAIFQAPSMQSSGMSAPADMTFAGGSSYIKGGGSGQQAMARQIPGVQQSNLSKLNMQNLSPEQQRMKRIEQNYLNDKAMLQKQQSQQNQPQQLARSESHSPGDESGNSGDKGGAAPADDGNVINKMSEDIFEEMKTELGSEF